MLSPKRPRRAMPKPPQGEPDRDWTGKRRRDAFRPRRLALWAVIQEVWVHGVSTRKVDDLVAAMGGCQVPKREVSRFRLQRQSSRRPPSDPQHRRL